MTIDTIFFDWGGVMADDPGGDFLLSLLYSLGASEEQAQAIRETYTEQLLRGDISETQYWQELRDHYGLTIHDTISDEFKRWRGLIINDDVMELSHKAREHGLHVALLTNVIEPTYHAIEQAGYYNHFDEVIASCKVGFAKPQPEIYRLSTDRLQTTAERSLLVDDKQMNLDAAKELGFATILAENPTQIIADVSAYINQA